MNRWRELYQRKLTTPDEAVKIIANGDRITVPICNGQPPALVSALARRVKKGELRDCVYLDALNIRCPDICQPDVIDKFHYESGYTTIVNRAAVNSGVGESNSIRFCEGPRLLREREFNVVMYCVAPMDQHGFFSCGTNADFAIAMSQVDYPHKILVEVNEKMPRTFGNNHIHITEVDMIVENTVPLTSLPPEPISPEDEAIGRFIADEIPDGACIQLGIGGVPNAVGKFLEEKKDLSVHTEMVCDSMVDLYYKGVITCKKKNYMPGKWITTFVFGSQAVYDFIDDNPLVEVWGVEWVNSPHLAGLNDNLMSINTTLEVDLSGQCASESIAFSQFTAVGGQADFVHAAWVSRGGKSFIATHSTYTDKQGQRHSKIVPVLSNFATVSRLDVQYVVTEYGIAYLKGKSIKTRVEELIRIAHPDFRDWLRSEAKRLKFMV